jgi:hypothetical protein
VRGRGRRASHYRSGERIAALERTSVSRGNVLVIDEKAGFHLIPLACGIRGEVSMSSQMRPRKRVSLFAKELFAKELIER